MVCLPIWKDMNEIGSENVVLGENGLHAVAIGVHGIEYTTEQVCQIIFKLMDSSRTSIAESHHQELDDEIARIKREYSSITQNGKEREKKYRSCLRSYQMYIKKESKVLEANIRHSEDRNKWYQQEARKCWENAIANRGIVLRSLARTNVLKRDADQWLAKIDDSVLEGQNSQAPQDVEDQPPIQGEAKARLNADYDQIYREYEARL